MIREKQRLLDGLQQGTSVTQQSRYERRQRYLRVREINHQLSDQLSTERDRLTAEMAALDQHLAANRVLRSREFSWALFPADRLQASYQGMFP